MQRGGKRWQRRRTDYKIPNVMEPDSNKSQSKLHGKAAGDQSDAWVGLLLRVDLVRLTVCEKKSGEGSVKKKGFGYGFHRLLWKIRVS